MSQKYLIARSMDVCNAHGHYEHAARLTDKDKTPNEAVLTGSTSASPEAFFLPHPKSIFVFKSPSWAFVSPASSSVSVAAAATECVFKCPARCASLPGDARDYLHSRGFLRRYRGNGLPHLCGLFHRCLRRIRRTVPERSQIGTRKKAANDNATW